ncbi:hypothetical protein MMC18_003688 [Xylographa bjoerkii]|nr:hypothetical protein [Xylographa bjoerkii]
MAPNDSFITRTINNGKAAAGDAAGSFIQSVGTGVNEVGGNISKSTRQMGNSTQDYGNSVKDKTKATGGRSQTAQNPLGLSRT